MAWPPPVLPVNRTDATPQTANHIADHNQANQAINDIVPQVQTLISKNALVGCKWINTGQSVPGATKTKLVPSSVVYDAGGLVVPGTGDMKAVVDAVWAISVTLTGSANPAAPGAILTVQSGSTMIGAVTPSGLLDGTTLTVVTNVTLNALVSVWLYCYGTTAIFASPAVTMTRVQYN